MTKIIQQSANSRIAEWLGILRPKIPEFQKQYDVRSLWLFGSYVRGEPKRHSDLDILVEFNRSPNLFDFIELEDQLSALLGVKVDLVMKKTLKPNIGRHILEEIIPV
jgi:hypothetical protein